MQGNILLDIDYFSILLWQIVSYWILEMVLDLVISVFDKEWIHKIFNPLQDISWSVRLAYTEQCCHLVFTKQNGIY